MSGPTPETQTIDVAAARAQWDELVDRVARRGERVILKESGKPVVALVSAKDFERLSRLEAERKERFKALEVTQDAFRGIPDAEVEREVDSALATVRARNRRRHVARTA